MNLAARDILAGAQVDGVRMLTDGRAADDEGGFDAIGILLFHSGCPHLLEENEWFNDPEHMAAHNECRVRMMMMYEIGIPEWNAINKEAADGWDFLTIAWMHTPGVTHLQQQPSGEEDHHGPQQP